MAQTLAILCSTIVIMTITLMNRLMIVSSANFIQDFEVTWSPSKVKLLDGGQELQLLLDSSSGSGFKSKKEYLFGNIDMQIKLVPGDSAGTVTAYYLSSQSSNHDELDFEFLGNVSGEPYALQTNVFANGIGGREQRIFLWFDPTTDFHTYSVSWTTQHIVFLVDGTPIRVFSNNENLGIAFPNKQPMGVYSSIWNGDQWATRGGAVKINWAHAPFVASYRNFGALPPNPTNAFILNDVQLKKLAWVKVNYMIYDYCSDKPRYPTTPLDCTHIF